MAADNANAWRCIMVRKNETTSTSTEATANPTVTLTEEALQRLLSQAAGEALDRQRAELKAAYQTVSAKAKAQNVAGKSERSAANELATIRAFQKAGFGVVTPRVNVKTFRRWIEEDGRRVIEGCKSLKVRNLRLFHVSQTRPLEPGELEAMQEQKSAADERQKGAKVIDIGTGANPQ
jgi:hypothetical protein